jgi:hypothetical protein
MLYSKPSIKCLNVAVGSVSPHGPGLCAGGHQAEYGCNPTGFLPSTGQLCGGGSGIAVSCNPFGNDAGSCSFGYNVYNSNCNTGAGAVINIPCSGGSIFA